VISIFGSPPPPLFNTFVLSSANSQTFCLPKMLCRHDFIPTKDDRIKFCHQSPFCQNLTSLHVVNITAKMLPWNAREGSSTLNDANLKQEQLMMPVARSHRYCQNYNLNHFLSNKHIYDITRLCWSLFHVVQPSAPQKQSQPKKNLSKSQLFNVLIFISTVHTHSLLSHIISSVPNFELYLRFVPIHWKIWMMRPSFWGCFGLSNNKRKQ